MCRVPARQFPPERPEKQDRSGHGGAACAAGKRPTTASRQCETSAMTEKERSIEMQNQQRHIESSAGFHGAPVFAPFARMHSRSARSSRGGAALGGTATRWTAD